MNLSSKLGLVDIGEEMQGKKVVVRVDYNVPMEKGEVMDSSRIKATLKTLEWILEKKPRWVVIISHLGRPDGQPHHQYSLQPVALKLQQLLARTVLFINECVGDIVMQQLEQTMVGQVVLLENLRFHPEEEGKGLDQQGHKVIPSSEEVEYFRHQLSQLGDIYVNDAFGTSHRQHSSIVGMQCERKVAGLLLKRELEYFGRALEQPKRPLVVVIGGAKVSDKIKLIFNIIDIADHIIIGGGMAFTFLKVLEGIPIGKSLYDEKGSEIIVDIMEKAKQRGVQVHLPIDFLCSDIQGEQKCEVEVQDKRTGISSHLMGLDIGPQTVQMYQQVVEQANTIIWNGPMGMCEVEAFRQGTYQLLLTIKHSTQQGALSIVGGGDSVAFVFQAGMQEDLSHVSTGGGATLELLEGQVLPGVKSLDNNANAIF